MECTTQEKGGEHPGRQGPLAAVQERAGEVIAGACAALLFATGTFQSGLGVVRAPRAEVETLTAGALEGPIFPAPHMDGGLPRFRVEEVVEMRHHRHG